MTDPQIHAFVWGAVVGMVFMSFAFAVLLRVMKPKNSLPPRTARRMAPPGASKMVPLMVAAFFISFTMLGQVSAAAAQTPVPIPTLNIPIADLFGQTNFWMATLSPVISIAVGAGIAVGLLLFVSAIIKGSFRGLG